MCDGGVRRAHGADAAAYPHSGERVHAHHTLLGLKLERVSMA